VPNALGALFVFSVPFLIGLAVGTQPSGADRGNFNWIAFLCVLPAAYLLVQSEFYGSSCPGGECIADGFALIFALLIAAVALGYLFGGVLGRFSQSAPDVAARAKQILRWLLVGAIVLLIVKIAITYSQGVARRHSREAAEAKFR
jgi:hypothetical protein